MEKRLFFKKIAVTLTLLLSLTTISTTFSGYSTPHDVTGLWRTKTGPRGGAFVVKIENIAGVLEGKIVKILNRPQNLRCTGCFGEYRNKPLVGLKIIWGLTKNTEGWANGHVVALKKGKVLKCSLKKYGDTIKIKVKYSIFSKTLEWTRYN
jgi:uncharacterized protein (DUF2147 family)